MTTYSWGSKETLGCGFAGSGLHMGVTIVVGTLYYRYLYMY